jgi:DNA primase small subunit
MDKSLSFIKKRFADYYKNTDLYLPERFGRREWGFMFLGESFMQRHLSFNKKDEVRKFLVNRNPAHVYHSAAYYEKPNASTMEEKVWLGADLIFDLDADHIKGAEKMTYEQTLSRVKEEFVRLLDEYLLGDFGFSEKDMQIVFSGGRGYHVHIRDPRVQTLSSHERREIVDYITGKGLDMDWIFSKDAFDKTTFGAHIKVRYKTNLPKENEKGWKKKMRKGVLNLISELEKLGEKEGVKRLRAFQGVGEKTAKGIYSELFSGEKGKRGMDKIIEDGIIEVFSDERNLDTFLKIVKGEIGIKMEDITEGESEFLSMSVKERMEGETDEPVTSDVKRLIRLPSSLHGKTGFKVVPMSRSELDDFEPLRDAVPEIFSDESFKIDVKNKVKIRLRGEEFDLKEGTHEVPEYTAIFLICRRAGTLVE